MNRKTATKLLLVQWSRFQNVTMRLEGSTLFTGVNGSGKSTILDAMTYLLAGNTQFNKAAKDRDRTVLAYVRGDTRSNGPTRYLREGEVVSYIAMEFWSPTENCYIVIGVCIESANETSYKSNWFLCRDAEIEAINFVEIEKQRMRITPRNELAVNGKRFKSADFMGRDRGVEQVLRALGLRCNVNKYRTKLLKMMAFNPENNIDQFIQECVLEPGTVESLKELREQRYQFEHIKQMYDNLRSSKLILEEVEKKTAEYETKLRNLQIKELMLSYQELREKEKEEQNTKFQMELLKHRQNDLEQLKIQLEQSYEEAGERYRIAENNDIFRGMNDSLQTLERQDAKLKEETEKYEEKIAKLKRLQMQIAELLKWTKDLLGITEEEANYLCNLAETIDREDRKAEVYLRFAAIIKKQKAVLDRDGVHFEDCRDSISAEIEELDGKIKDLESNKMRYPTDIEKAKQILTEELVKQGINTEVRVFAELVQEVRNNKWRAAIETFLGRKRFYIIVDGKYCHKVMEILQMKKLHHINVVVTDKLPNTEITAGSAAEVLDIPNIYARRYANYLLNGIHLCDTLEELHEHPKGGLMQNGMLAKSYAVSSMNIKKTEFCLGKDAIALQLKHAIHEKAQKMSDWKQINKSLEENQQQRLEIDRVDWNEDKYDFQAAVRLEEVNQKRNKVKEDIDRVQNNPDFLAVLQEREEARKAYQLVKKQRDNVVGDISKCVTELDTCQNAIKEIAGLIYSLKQEYSQKSMQHLELIRPMQEEYERLRARKDSLQVTSIKTINNLRSELSECIRQLENIQIDYCKLAEIDINKRGVAYIPFFREEYRTIANIKIEEAHQKLQEQAEKLESSFMNDFVAEMNEMIREAKTEMEAINRELKQIPFGNDTYKFMMKEKGDRLVFFRICRKLENYMDSSEIYMNSARDDEEMEHDIQDFMSMILNEEDEEEYTDYRKYFSYDMEIVSKQGDSETVSDLSKKQGSASNGEKQTPYFIILAASLLQCYPKQACCARLAFIDEAFSALSRERIEQMVKYFEENHFQVIYAAPPEKISSIGSFIKSTVSLVITGRYTNAIEGLVREYE